MTGGSRIVAIDASTPDSAQADLPLDNQDVSVPVAAEPWEDEAQPLSRRSPYVIAAAALCVLAAIGWTALFYSVHRPVMNFGASAADWMGWIRDWSIPVILIGVVWLIVMRNSRREAHRFGQTARLLSEETISLERRLSTVNGELSLAREFLASQARDLEALGRLATDKLAQHSERMSTMIHDNGARLDTIGTVSATALENMERLRGQLPVIASSAKDVSNNIATAGRTAKGQLDEMVQGFNRLNEFGQASERQVASLRLAVDETIAEFAQRGEQLEAIATERFAALSASSGEFRMRLDADEIDALAAIRTRAKALADDIAATRDELDTQEQASLASLRSRLGAVRDEGGSISRSLRDSETAALNTWKQATAHLEESLQTTLAKIAEIDGRAMESARERLLTISQEAADLDARMSERDKLFHDEVGKRSSDFDQQHAEFADRLSARLAALDQNILQRQNDQDEHARRLTEQTQSISARLAELTAHIDVVSAHGTAAEESLGAALTTLADKLLASRTALDGTGGAVADLTNESVRLLEIIRASVDHSSKDLPDAIASGEAKLIEVEQRALALRTTVAEAELHGAALSSHVISTKANVDESREAVQAFHDDFATKAQVHNTSLDEMRAALETVRTESIAVAELAQASLANAIDQLSTSARGAVAAIETQSAEAIAGVAARLGRESGAAIDDVMRTRTADAAVQLEQATANAAGISRQAAIQLRDQLAKVSELTANLEQRVEHARVRAEEQVDNDFARRVALINESLNSSAIDLTRAMDTEVSDTAWAAYLKGDRGIFTRRAVKLLETPDAKAVAQLYDDNRAFRENVSRYIHDFEAMLRQLLSTRDGHAIGVTLLSSDMGKLYVALAQSIDRLRS